MVIKKLIKQWCSPTPADFLVDILFLQLSHARMNYRYKMLISAGIGDHPCLLAFL